MPGVIAARIISPERIAFSVEIRDVVDRNDRRSDKPLFIKGDLRERISASLAAKKGLDRGKGACIACLDVGRRLIRNVIENTVTDPEAIGKGKEGGEICLQEGDVFLRRRLGLPAEDALLLAVYLCINGRCVLGSPLRERCGCSK